jgi:hypothetical protein
MIERIFNTSTLPANLLGRMIYNPESLQQAP